MHDSFAADAQNLAAILDLGRNVAHDFLTTLDDRPVACQPEALEPQTLPDQGMGAAAALEEFRRRFEPGLSGSAGPRYLGFVTGGSTPAALLGDWLASAYDQNLSNGGDSSATNVEHEALAMLRSLFGLGDGFHGAFISGATMANTVALATARQWVAQRLGIDAAEDGLWSLPRISVFSGAPHASIYKALSMLGMGRSSVVEVACLPDRQAVDPAALRQQLKASTGPAIVVASAGDVNTGDFDDLVALAELCQSFGAWLHVDGAFGLFAACDPEQADRLAGLEMADSVATDGHKWLNVPYDSGIVFSRHLELQESVFRAAAAYLGDGPDLLHRTAENSRRFRALAAWMSLQAYGRAGYRGLVQQCCALADRLATALADSDHFELLAPVHSNIVCFALRHGDEAARDRVLAEVARGGEAYLSPTYFAGRPGMRAAFVNWRTRDADIERVLAALEQAAAG